MIARAATCSLLALALPLAGACVAEPPPDNLRECPIVSSGDWRAWVNAMPGTQRRLLVTGRVTVPTGGYRVRLELGAVQEIHPPIQQVELIAQPPSGGASQAIVTHDVRGEFKALPDDGAVTVRCGSATLAEIRPVPIAH